MQTNKNTLNNISLFVNQKRVELSFREKNGIFSATARIKNTGNLSGLAVYTTGQKLNFEQISSGIYRLKTSDFVANAIVAKNLITVSIRPAGVVL